uniref:Secreted protein n=1 Tax=Babesia bovis TaxID=5865 RepID=S6B0B8_BABBO|nr:hypothetical protein NY2A_b318L [Babesia bovis]
MRRSFATAWLMASLTCANSLRSVYNLVSSTRSSFFNRDRFSSISRRTSINCSWNFLECLSRWNCRNDRSIKNSGVVFSILMRLSSMLYPRWNELSNLLALPMKMALASSGLMPRSIIIITRPCSSRPLLPARPAICMYSPEVMSLLVCPSHLLRLVNTTHLAGMLTPIEKVSVLNSTLIRPSWNNISIISLMMGRSPP